MFGVGGCAWRVTPPREPVEPQVVFLSQYDRHTRLAVPAAGGLIEYGFGEWHFYGLEEHGPGPALRAIIGRGRGAWSRRVLPAAGTADEYRRRAGSVRTAAIRVESGGVRMLRDRLEARWREICGDAVRRQHEGLPVAPDPREGYHLFRNSNAVVAGWLRQLGCDVRGLIITSDFRVPGWVEESGRSSAGSTKAGGDG